MKKFNLKLLSLFTICICMVTSANNVAAKEEPLQQLTVTNETTQAQFLHFTPVELDTLTNDEKKFVEEAKFNNPGVYQLDNLYVITLGEKPNSGYAIEFVDSQTSFEKEQIHVKLTEPNSDYYYNDVITYPYIVGRMDLPSKYMSIEVIDTITGKFVFEESGQDETDKYNAVDISKEWIIHFNAPLKKETITEENIYIYEKANGAPISKFPVKLIIMNDGQSVKVKPKTKYKFGQQYTLFISKKVSSTKNTKMKKDRFVAFTTKTATDSEVQPTDPSKVLKFTYTFEDGTNGWEGNFSDYREGMEIKAEFTHSTLPKEIGENTKGLYISSSNRSDDVFMFIKKKLDINNGIKPNTTYLVNLQFDLGTNVGTDLDIGIGGSPGGSVFVKAGATSVEPKPILDKQYYRANIYYGNQSTGGIDAGVLGDIFKKSEGKQYELKSFERNFEVTTDNNSALWLLIGTDSGFEGTTNLYYTNIHVELIEK